MKGRHNPNWNCWVYFVKLWNALFPPPRVHKTVLLVPRRWFCFSLNKETCKQRPCTEEMLISATPSSSSKARESIWLQHEVRVLWAGSYRRSHPVAKRMCLVRAVVSAGPVSSRHLGCVVFGWQFLATAQFCRAGPVGWKNIKRRLRNRQFICGK